MINEWVGDVDKITGFIREYFSTTQGAVSKEDVIRDNPECNPIDIDNSIKTLLAEHTIIEDDGKYRKQQGDSNKNDPQILKNTIDKYENASREELKNLVFGMNDLIDKCPDLDLESRTKWFRLMAKHCIQGGFGKQLIFLVQNCPDETAQFIHSLPNDRDTNIWLGFMKQTLSNDVACDTDGKYPESVRLWLRTKVTERSGWAEKVNTWTEEDVYADELFIMLRGSFKNDSLMDKTVKELDELARPIELGSYHVSDILSELSGCSRVWDNTHVKFIYRLPKIIWGEKRERALAIGQKIAEKLNDKDLEEFIMKIKDEII